MSGVPLTSQLFLTPICKGYSYAPTTAYSIRAESEGPNGAAFVREAVVQLGAINQILAWREGAGTKNIP
jgi:hypothetical protein